MTATAFSGRACRTCPYHNDRCDGLGDAPAGTSIAEGSIGCCDAARRKQYHDDLESLRAANQNASLQPVSNLPAFIPVLVRVLRESVGLPASRLYGVSWTTVVKRTGDPRYQSAQDLRQDLGLGADEDLCLIGTGHDGRLESAWAKSEVNDLWSKLEGHNFKFATSTTFSVWERQPRFDQIYNQDRNLYSFDRFASLGVPALPFVFYPEDADLRAIVKWLEERPEIDAVAVLAQYHRSLRAFERLLAGMDTLADESPRPLRFLVIGAATRPKIERLFAEFPTASVASTKPVMKALRGHATTPDLGHEEAPTVDRAALINPTSSASRRSATGCARSPTRRRKQP